MTRQEISSGTGGESETGSRTARYERIPLTEDIDDYHQREVKPHLPDSWLDRKKDKVGYEINFNRYFYQYTSLRSLKAIADEIVVLERQVKAC